jgi:glycosyltransferase involved in cell wall biosynthesis
MKAPQNDPKVSVVRIAIWHNLPSGGGKRALHDQVRGLSARGHYLESWCPPSADQELLSIGDLVTENIIALEDFEGRSPRAVAARLVGGGTKIPARLKAMDRHSQICAQQINKGGFDVVLGSSSQLLAVTGLARYLSIPTVLYLHEPYRMLYEAQPRLVWAALPKPERLDLGAVRERLYDALWVHALRIQAREEVSGAKAYDRVLANSHFTRESILRAYGIDAAVCYPGVDTDLFFDQGLTRGRLVVGLGAFIPPKRVEVAIEAVGRISRDRPGLAWVGNCADRSYMAELVSLANRRRVTFTPYVGISQEKLCRVLNEAAVMVYAPRLEPFGYAPVEAAACGLPVVARAEGGVRETVVNDVTGFLVEDDDELPVALERVLDDPALAGRMGLGGRERAQSVWSLSAAIDRLESHLVEVAAGRRAGGD